MSQVGAEANRRRAVDRMVAEHAQEMAEKVFRPMLRQQIQRAQVAEERAAILQTALERIAIADPDVGPLAMIETAAAALEQLGIVPDVATFDADSTPQTSEAG